MLLEIVTVPWRSSKGWIVFHTYIYINIISIKMEIKFIKRHKNATKTLWFGVCSCFEKSQSSDPKEQSFLQHFSDKVLHVFILCFCCCFLFHPCTTMMWSSCSCWNISYSSAYKILSSKQMLSYDGSLEQNLFIFLLFFHSNRIYFGLVCLLPSPWDGLKTT